MDIDSIINKIGFCITITSAIYTTVQAIRARRIADEIKITKIKNSLIDLIQKGKIAREETRKIGFPENSKSLRGFNRTDSIRKILAFLESLNDSQHLFDDEDLKKIANETQKIIEKYQNEKTLEEGQEFGKELHQHLNDIISILQEKFDTLK